MNRLVTWLMPARRHSEATDDDRLLVSITLITLPFALLYASISHLIGFHIGEKLMLLCFALLLATLRLFQLTGRYRLCANAYLGICFTVAILGCSFFTCGIHSMVTPWFCLVPVASVLLRELESDSIAWTLLSCTAVLAYGLTDMAGYTLPILYDQSYTGVFSTICIVGLAVILFWIAFMFGHIRSKAMATIVEQKAFLQEALAEIEQLAFYDPLTQLPNRRLFLDRLGQAVAENKRNAVYGALMFLDLDNFKPLNDTYGHDAGDLLLIEAARRLGGCMRDSDTVARFGGDEFAIILGTLDADLDASKHKADIVAGKIAATLAEPYLLPQYSTDVATLPISHSCTASIGIVLFGGQNDGQKELLVAADKAMYQAKLTGKNAIVFHRHESATS